MIVYIEFFSYLSLFNINKNIRDELGISDSLERLSIGIEDPEDLKTA